MSDLESALHYSLRVELSGHISISGDDLIALKKYINVLAKVSYINTHTHTLNIHLNYFISWHLYQPSQLRKQTTRGRYTEHFNPRCVF